MRPAISVVRKTPLWDSKKASNQGENARISIWASLLHAIVDIAKKCSRDLHPIPRYLRQIRYHTFSHQKSNECMAYKISRCNVHLHLIFPVSLNLLHVSRLVPVSCSILFHFFGQVNRLKELGGKKITITLANSFYNQRFLHLYSQMCKAVISKHQP